jgi:hypothetical protein
MQQVLRFGSSAIIPAVRQHIERARKAAKTDEATQSRLISHRPCRASAPAEVSAQFAGDTGRD